MSSHRFSPPVARPARWARVVVVIVFMPFMRADTAGASDPFYDRLLRDGINAYERSDHAEAAQSLRLACFGLLEEPTVLARGLTYLALAQAELEDELEFNHTFTRILEVERRFQGFSQLELNADLRQLFDAHLYRWIELDQLEGLPAFLGVARRKQESQIVELAPAERRPELERLVATEPDNPTWRLLLAELQLDSGEYEAVQATADAVLARDPQLGQALCLRGRAAAVTGSCERTLTDLESCPDSVDQTTLAEARLSCLIQLQDWQNASVVLAGVPPAQQKKQPFRQFARDIRKGRKAGPPPAATVPDAATVAVPDETPEPPVESLPDPGEGFEIAATATPEATAGTAPTGTEQQQSSGEAASPPQEETPSDDVPTGPGPNAPSTWPPELQAELERTRQLVPSASRGELAEAFTAARELADRYRQLAEPQHLAAEIAYRLSRWDDAVTFFERGGEPAPSQPGRLFYFSVALYETGDRAEARRVLERCLPALEMTTFVQSYVDEILGADHEQADLNSPGR